MTRKFENDPVADLYAEIAAIREQLNGLQRQDRITVPIRKRSNLPLGVEGEIVTGDATSASTFSDKSLYIFLDNQWWEIRSVAPALSTLITFTAYRTSDSGYQSIYVINSDGTGLVEVFAASPAATDFSLALSYEHVLWSRNKSLAYASQYYFPDEGDDEYILFQVAPDGTGAVFIADAILPSSPSGGHSSFKDTLDAGPLFVFSTTTSPADIRLYDVTVPYPSVYTTIFTTSALPSPFTNGSPRFLLWSPDGSKISFWVDASGWGLFTMNRDGSNLQGPILDYTTVSTIAAWWLPDNSKMSYLDSSSFIATINDDGTGATTIGTLVTSAADAWSPDGTKIAYVNVGGDYLVHIMNADGTGDVSIPSSDIGTDQATNGRLSWSDDGTKLVRISYGTTPTMKVMDAIGLTVTATIDLTGQFYYASEVRWNALRDSGSFS